MESAVWISYDLGVQADYEGMYSWLDEHQAKECGDSLAFFNYEYSGSLLDALTDDCSGPCRSQNEHVSMLFTTSTIRRR